MAKVVVIGVSSLIGSYFIDNNFDYDLICFSRNNKNYNYQRDNTREDNPDVQCVQM